MADLGPITTPALSVRIVGQTKSVPTCEVVGLADADVALGASSVQWVLRFTNDNDVAVELYGWTFTPSVGGVLTDMAEVGIKSVPAKGLLDVTLTGTLNTTPSLDAEGVAACTLDVVVMARTV